MAARPGATETVEHEVRIDATPETVFEFFTDPAKMVRWMGVEATLDPRPGGICRVNPNGEAVASGEFVEVVPYSRVVFTWGWELELLAVPPASTTVEVALVPEGDGTLVRLTHSELPPDSVAFHRRGWGHYLGRLEVAAAGRDPGPDPFIPAQ